MLQKLIVLYYILNKLVLLFILFPDKLILLHKLLQGIYI